MNRRLTEDELVKAWAVIELVREEIEGLAGGDPALRFAYRRKIWRELYYLERGRPLVRRALKERKGREQGGICPLCRDVLPEKNAVLDRLEAQDGYTMENTRLIHDSCDRKQQASKAYR